MAQRVKRLPAMQDTQVRSLGWEDPLEKEMATHSSTLAWKIPWMEEPEDGVAKSRTRLSAFTLKGFSGGAVLKNPPAMQEMEETLVWPRPYLGGEDPLEE